MTALAYTNILIASIFVQDWMRIIVLKFDNVYPEPNTGVSPSFGRIVSVHAAHRCSSAANRRLQCVFIVSAATQRHTKTGTRRHIWIKYILFCIEMGWYARCWPHSRKHAHLFDFIDFRIETLCVSVCVQALNSLARSGILCYTYMR